MPCAATVKEQNGAGLLDREHGHNRLAFCLANMIGSVVQVQMTSGAVYQGVLHSALPHTDQPHGGVGVVLKKAFRKLDAPGGALKFSFVHQRTLLCGASPLPPPLSCLAWVWCFRSARQI